jgi:putative intracellular protease/amidase
MQAMTGAAAIAMAVAAGILTLVTPSNWWSYAMAAGFIAALICHGSLLLPATQPVHDT